MKRKPDQYDIFISYRRDGGIDTAKHLRDILTDKGYRVFFDTDSLRSGDFNTALLDIIKNCTDFIIILNPGALDRCVNENDWVRQELACALKTGKNVIPVTASNFHFPKELPEDINSVRWKNCIHVNYEFFDAMVDKLVSFLHSRPHRPIVKWLLPVAVLLVAASAIAVVLFGRPSVKKENTPEAIAAEETSDAPASDPAASDSGTAAADTNAEPVISAPDEASAAGQAVTVPVSHYVEYSYYADYIPRGTAVITDTSGKQYFAVANSLVLETSSTMFKGLFSDASNNSDESYSFIDDVSFNEMLSLKKTGDQTYMIERIGKEDIEVTQDDGYYGYGLLFIEEGASERTTSLKLSFVDSITFDWDNTPDTNLRYCEVDLGFVSFKCPIAFVWFGVNVAPSGMAPNIKLTQNLEQCAGMSAPVAFMKKITSETRQDDTNNPTRNMVAFMTVTMKNGDTSEEFRCGYFFNTYFMGLDGAVINPLNTDIKEVRF